MTTKETIDLFANTALLPGNLAKLKILDELQRLVESRDTPLTVLDVGCVGPTPFNLWQAFFVAYGDRIRLTGIDVRGIDEARRAANEMGIDVELLEMSSYDMSCHLEGPFDVVVSTQVLEHLSRPEAFFRELAGVMSAGTVAYVTLDSGHFERHSTVELWVRYFVGRFIAERYYDVGLRKDQLADMTTRSGFQILDRRFYNIHPMKRIHNHQTSDANKNAFLRRWFDLEENLNDDKEFLRKHAGNFAGIYLKLSLAADSS